MATNALLPLPTSLVSCTPPQVVAKDIRMSPEDLGPLPEDSGGLETDAAISRGRGGCDR